MLGQIKFPERFLWGAATSAYQVEGHNDKSDWWYWEKERGLQQSAEACRHYQLFGEDFSLAKELKHNCHRLSIEWARIEPQKGSFSQEAIYHYKEVIRALRELNIEPVVTLHHFTNPEWFLKEGGWENKEAAGLFLRYVEKIVGELAEGVRFWLTVNEPLVYLYHSYIIGAWPPEKRSISAALRVEKNFILSHIRAYKAIHKIYKSKNLGAPLVGIAHNMQYFEACKPSIRNKIAVSLRDWLFNFRILNILKNKHCLDFIGLNYYNRSLVELKGLGVRNFIVDACENKNHSSLKKNSMGWDIYPYGLYRLLLRLKAYRLPVLITENGICTEDDSLRWEFIRDHLKGVRMALEQGVEVIGYIYWSLIDNFEWDKGFAPRFGLIEVDYANYRRSIRESAWKFAEVIAKGKINEDGIVQ